MFKHYPRFLVIKIIKFYQKTLSFDQGLFKGLFPGGYCRYQPTCSEYAIQAVENFGVLRGTLKASWRILRCNPWSKGGWDPATKASKN